MTRTVLRVDAGREIGHGHLVRILALGEELAGRPGWECTIVTRSDIGEQDFPVVVVPEDIAPADEDSFLASLGSPPGVVIADLYRPAQSHLDALARGPWALVCIDDESEDLLFDCDLLVEPSLDSTLVHRRSERGVYLRGGQAIMLRPQFRALPRHEARVALGRLLVCFGGTDPCDMTGTFLDAYLGGGLPSTIDQVTVVLGGGYAGAAEAAARLNGRAGWRLLRDVADMAPLMREADAGLLAAGTLLYEALASGLPSVLLAANEPQAREAEEVARLGAARYAGPMDEVTRSVIDATLGSLEDPSSRADMSRRAMTLVDGRGLERVADAVVEAAGRR